MVEIQPVRNEGEEETSLAIYNAVWPWDAVSLENVHSFRDAALAYVDIVARLEDQPVGSVAAAQMPHRPTAAVLLLTVLPQHRRRGAGTALYAAASAWAAERELEGFDAVAPEDDPESIAFAERRGFVEVERNSRMTLDLPAVEPPAVAPPEGIEIVTWAERPELARAVYEVALEAYPDVPGRGRDELEPFEGWLEHDMQGSGDKPEATFLALAGDEVVGFAKFSLTEAQPHVAFHDMTGVKRAWRGRGIAGALKRAQIAWAKAAGFERLQTQNEVRNEPIRRLNERLGYRLAPGRVTLRGPLASKNG